MFPDWFFLVVMVIVLHSCAASVSFKQHSEDNTLYEISDNRRGDYTQIRIEDSGHAANCGPAANKMDFSWSPKILHKSTNPLTVTLDMLATVDLNSGNVVLNVTDKVEPGTPIFQSNQTGGCQSLQQFGFKNLKCPVKAKDQIKTYITKTDVPTLPEGEFIIMIVVTNQAKEVFACVKADVTIKG